jgi:hypothetical protein
VASGTSSRSIRASSTGAVGGRSAQDDSGRVVGADGEDLSRVDATSDWDGVDARCDSRDGGRNANISVSSRLGGNDSVGSRLGRNRGGSSGHASHNTQRVGLLEVAGLGEGVDRSSLCSYQYCGPIDQTDLNIQTRTGRRPQRRRQ